jgi:serine O-acetyltransferase
MTYSQYKYLIFSDLYRRKNNVSVRKLIQEIFNGESYKYIFWLRTTTYCKSNTFFKYTLYRISKMMLNHYTYKFSISINISTEIGSGFYIGHFSGIFINKRCVLGKNINLSQGVTLGGTKKGFPILENNIYIGPGAKLIGNVHIGNNVTIGANCVVTKDIPDNCVVVGIPGKIISKNNQTNYIINTEYDSILLKDNNK